MYRKANVCIETYNGLLVVDGWEFKDRHWNGWSIPVFGKVAADAVAQEIGLDYDEKTKTYTETPKSNGDNDYFESWTIGHNEELGQETVAIGACSWCWSFADDEELKTLDMKIIDRREYAKV